MICTNCFLGDNWDIDEWPDYIIAQKNHNGVIVSKRYIDIDSLNSIISKHYAEGYNDAQEFVRRLVRDMESLPLGLVRVVLCKNCKWFKENDCAMLGISIEDSAVMYCKYGELKVTS